MTEFVPSEIIHLSSDLASASGLYNSDCTFRLNKQIEIPNDDKAYVSLINLKAPFTWYAIDANNDRFEIEFSDASTQQFTIPHGVYAGDARDAPGPQFALVLAALLGTSNINWGVGFNYNTFAIDFAFINGTVNPVNLRFPVGSTLWKNFGFTSADDVAFIDNGTSHIASTGVLRLHVIEDMYLRCNLINDHVYGCTPNGGTESNILSKITVDRAPGQFIDFYPYNKNAIALSKNKIEEFRLLLTDINGKLINFRDIPWTATLRFDYRQGVTSAKYAKSKKVSS